MHQNCVLGACVMFAGWSLEVIYTVKYSSNKPPFVATTLGSHFSNDAVHYYCVLFKGIGIE